MFLMGEWGWRKEKGENCLKGIEKESEEDEGFQLGCDRRLLLSFFLFVFRGAMERARARRILKFWFMCFACSLFRMGFIFFSYLVFDHFVRCQR